MEIARRVITKSAPADHYKWWVVGMLWFVCLLNYADRQALFSLFPLLKSEMALSDIQLGIIGSSFMWVYALSAPLSGLIGDRLKRKSVILGGLLFWSLITLAIALSRQYWHLVFLRALQGLGESLYFPAAMSLVSDYHGPDTRSRAMSLHQSSVYAGTILGGAGAGFLGQHYGWRAGCFLFGLFGVVLSVVLVRMLREPVRGQADAGEIAGRAGGPGLLQELADIFKHPMVAILMAVFIGANFVAMIFLTWMPSFLYRKFQMSLSMAGLSATAYLQLASVLGVMSGGVLADRLVRRSRAGRMQTQVVGLFAGVPFIFLTGWTRSVPMLTFAMTGFGYFKGLYDANLWASLYDVTKVERRATALGLMNAVGWVGGGAAPVAIGFASQRFGMSACISATSIIYLLVGVMLIVGLRTYMSQARRR
jgi:MFS family permease